MTGVQNCLIQGAAASSTLPMHSCCIEFRQGLEQFQRLDRADIWISRCGSFCETTRTIDFNSELQAFSCTDVLVLGLSLTTSTQIENRSLHRSNQLQITITLARQCCPPCCPRWAGQSTYHFQQAVEQPGHPDKRRCGPVPSCRRRAAPISNQAQD